MADLTSEERIEAAISPRDHPTRACCDRAPSAQMLAAFEQFNRGEFWEQHETLEAVWRAETEPSIRNFYKGIIQVGVGFYHLRRGNYPGVIKVLGRGIRYLEPYAPECCGVDVARLLSEAKAIYFQARDLGPARLGEIGASELPRVHYLERSES